MLSLALAMHAVAATLNTRALPAADGGPALRPQWRLRVGVAWGGAVSGSLGAQRRRCHFFGGAVAEAVRLVRECPPGETRVQRRLARADGAQAFTFAPAAPCPTRGPTDALRLLGRRRQRWPGGGGDDGGEA
jgi:class 3 adenylate cyclase